MYLGVSAATNVLDVLTQGGDAQYHPLAPGSPAQDQTGAVAGEFVDQLGNVPGNGDTLRDIGAHELAGAPDTQDAEVLFANPHIREDVPSNTIVTTATATPPWRDYTYTIVGGDPGNVFAINAATGEIRVADSSRLDSESVPAYLLRIQANSVGHDPGFGYVRILVDSVNESPELGAARSFQLAKSAKEGDTVGYVTGFDPDAGDVLGYAINGSSPVERAIEINPATGEITVLDPSELRDVDALDFTVVAEDIDGLRDSVEVHVELFEVPLLDPDYDGGEPIDGVDVPEPIVVVGTQPDAAYRVSHRKELVFNPLATVTNAPGKDYRVEYLRDSGSTALSVTYSADGTLLSGAGRSASLALGKLTVREDGALVYKPNDDLVADNELTTPGPGGSFYYANEELSLRVVDTANGEVLLDDHPATIAVTNTLPVFRSEYLGAPGGEHILSERPVTDRLDATPIKVYRHQSQTIDLSDVLYDPDGDAITVARFVSDNILINHANDPRIPGGNPVLGEDEASGDDTLSIGFGYKMTSLVGGYPTAVRELTLTEFSTPEQSSRVEIYHDGVNADDAFTNFSDTGFANRFTFVIETTDGQVDDSGESIVANLVVVIDPVNESASSAANPTEAAWLDTAKRSPAVTDNRDDAVLDPARWSLAATDIQAGREGAELEVVGDALVDLVDGSLIRRHALTLDGSGGAAEATLPGLIYDSATVDPRPVIEATLVAPSDFADNFDEGNIDSFTVKFTWYDHVNTPDGSPRELVTSIEYTGDSLKSLNFTEPIRYAFQPPEEPLFTGVYRWKVEFVIDVENDATGFSGETMTLTQTGETAVVVQKKVTAGQFGGGSPTKWDYTPQFGDGWALEGAPQLFVDDYRTSDDDGDANDRLILWFPGEQPRVFGLGSVGLENSYSRQVYENGGFAPIELRTGLSDPLEYGTLRARTIDLFDEEGDYFCNDIFSGCTEADGEEVDAIIYTSADSVSYVFTREDVANSDAVAPPAWLLREIRDPRADKPITFEYAVDNDDDPPMELVRIIGTDDKPIGVSSSGSSPRTVTFDLVGGASQTDLRINDSTNQLHQVEHSNTRVRDFTYDDDSALLESDNWGVSERATEFTFNGFGQLASVDHGGAVHQIRTVYHDAITSSSADAKLLDATRVATTLVDNSDSNQNDDWRTRHTFDVEGNRLQTETYFGELDKASDLVSIEAWTYDHLGSVKSYTDPIGRVSYFQHDYQSPAAEAVNPSSDTSGQYDPDDYRGNVTRVGSFSGATRFEYSTDDAKFGAMGRLVRQVDPNGLVTRRVWNRYGQLTELHVGDDYTETWVYYHTIQSQDNDDHYNEDWAGLVYQHTDARGLTTTFEYDFEDDNSTRQVVSAVAVDEGAAGVTGEARRTEYTYDGNGYLDKVTVKLKVGDGAEQVLSFTDYDYDDTGLLEAVVVKDRDHASAEVLSSSSYTYFHDGLVHTETIGASGDQSVTIYTYDQRGLLKKVERDRDQSSGTDRIDTDYLYYEDGRLQKTTLPDGTEITEAYTVVEVGGRNELRQRTTTDGVATLSEYDNATLPFETTSTSQSVDRFFDEAGRLVEVHNRLTGARTEYEFSDLRHDTATRVSESVNLGGSVADTVDSFFVYDLQGNVVYEAAPGQAARSHRYSDIGYLLETNVLARNGARMVYVNNGAGDVVEEIEVRKQPDGQAVAFATDYAYDESGRLRQVKDKADAGGAERVSDVDYDVVSITHATLGDIFTREVETESLEGVTTKQYFDGAGQLVREVNAYGGVTDHAYNQRGLLTQTTEMAPNGGANRITTFEYDGLGRPTAAKEHGATKDSGNELVTSTLYNDGAGGWDVTVTDPYGVKTHTEFDSLGALVAMREAAKDPADKDADLLVLNSYTYNAASGTAIVTTRTTSPRGQAEIANASRQHDETTVSRQLLNTRGDVLQSGVRTTGLEVADNVLPAGAFPALDVFGPDFRVEQTNTYGKHGLVRTQTIGEKQTTTYEYDTQQSGLLAVSRMRRPGQVVTTQYDSAGNRVTQEVNGANRVTWEYDQAGRVVAESTEVALGTEVGDETTAVNRSWAYTGLSTTYLDRNGVTVVTTVSANRLTTTEAATYSNGAVLTATTLRNPDGSTAEVTRDWAGGDRGGDASNVSYEYDEYGRLDKQTNATDALDEAFASEFDDTYRADGTLQNRAWGIDLDGGASPVFAAVLTNAYTQDSRGRLDSIAQAFAANSGALWTDVSTPDTLNKSVAIDYNANGSVEQVTRSAGSAIGASQYGYDDTGRLEWLRHGADDDAEGVDILASYYQEFDANNQLRHRTEAFHAWNDAANDYVEVRGIGSGLEYDAQGRLVSQFGDTRTDPEGDTGAPRGDTDLESFRYDDFGNRVDRQAQVRAGNRLVEDAQYAYEYDGEGNLTLKRELATGDEWRYAWDHRSRLLSVDFGKFDDATQDYLAEYAYDALGRRSVKRVTGPGVANQKLGYVWDGPNRQFTLDRDLDLLSESHLHGVGGELLAVDQGRTVWALSDMSGTVQTVAFYDDLDATPHWEVAHRDFGRFGEQQPLDVTFDNLDVLGVEATADRLLLGNEVDVLASTPVVFQGGVWDEHAGLYTLGGRQYDPFAGRYASDAGGVNGYLFSENAPDRNRVVGESETDDRYGLIRGLVGDETLAGASDTQLFFGTTAGAAGAVFGAYYALGAFGLVGTGGFAATTAATTTTGATLQATGSLLTYGSLGYSAAQTALTGQGTGDLLADSASLAIDAVSTATTGRLRAGLLLADGAINYIQGGRATFIAADALREGDYLGGSLHLVGAGLGFGSAFTRHLQLADLAGGPNRLGSRAGVLRFGTGNPVAAEAVESGTLTVLRGHHQTKRAISMAEVHHLASDKGPLRDDLEKILLRAGLSFDSPFNNVRIPGHASRHGIYNRIVLEQLSQASQGKVGSAFRAAVIDELLDLRYRAKKGDLLDLLKAPASRAEVALYREVT